MPINADRRLELADAAVTVIGRDGMRALTHRAVDAEAEVPTGTASNYFRSRAELVDAAAEVAVERLRPESADGLDAVVEQALVDPDAALAWFELRLHAVREPDGQVAALVAERDAELAALAAALPGGAAEHRRVVAALDGILLAGVSGAASQQETLRDAEAVVRGIIGGRSGGIRGLFGR